MSEHEAHPPRLSLVVPAWNEEACLPRLLESIDVARRRFRGPGSVEVIVADNGSTDRTAAIAREHGCRVTTVERRSIAAARNGGAALARGELLAFADADFRIHPDSFDAIDAVMRDGRYVGGGTGLRLERSSIGIATTLLLILPPLKLLGLDGGIWFCRRDDFEQLGGYDESLMLGEDVRFLLALKRLGRTRRPRQRLARETTLPAGRRAPVVASARKFDRHGEWHMLRIMITSLPLAVVSRRAAEQRILKYWYGPR